MAKKTTIHDVIEHFRHSDNVTKGTKFEELMVQYFQLDPTLASEYDIVQRWPEWDHNENTHDNGIDLVARHQDTGEWTAIQCKFYDPKHSLQRSDIDSFFTASGQAWDGVNFTNRIIISTTDKWSKNAESALKDQQIPVQRIGLVDIAEVPLDWMQISTEGLDFELRKAVRYSLRPHQKEAVAAIRKGFETHDRGQWISACGTGKTFTSLKLAEQMCTDNGGRLKVLFLAPSISLVSQTLREWMAQSLTPIRPLVVCSDTKASKDAEDISTYDIPLPTTDAARLAENLAAVGRRGRHITVVFSTYQSIDVVAKAQQSSAEDFDLILCDEAHRTTGVTLSGDTSESAFVKVHDNTYLPADKRLYMTATPRIYGDTAKQKADEASAVLTSMDNEDLFGPEFHRLGFGDAVEKGLLTDYKVMILAVAGDAIADQLQNFFADDNAELSLDEAAKIVGCWNGLAKRTTDGNFGPNPIPMKRAVAFCQDIKTSKAFAESFPQVVESLAEEDRDAASVAVHHVDGSMNALVRSKKLAWLKAPIPDGETRILSNARCLSEGVDVPALDAVLFLHPRNSLVDVVQSVGRVMRKAKGKDFGYVILPVAIPAGTRPEEALKDNKRFKVVWDVLNALRSHDDRFNAMINSIELDKNTKDKIILDVFDPRGGTEDDDGGDTKPPSDGGFQLPLFGLEEWKDSILARIVKKVGDREYWDAWADDVVDIHANQTARIKAIVHQADASLRDKFEAFHQGLKDNLNDSITIDSAIDMLSQHLITRPVFEALFAHDSFAAHNPVSITMQRMVNALAGHGLDAETAKLDSFYASVRRRAEGINTPAGRQTVIHELYEQFFKKAFPKQASSFGVVYTPVEIVDFILRAADEVCRQEFGYGLTDEGVHILDPFTGTGTFMVRLLESGIIRPEDLARKYSSELWANEIMLLAYYIACVNIETTYQAIATANLPEGAEPVPYQPFPGATLTDTFQITEESDRADTSLIPMNNDRINAQLEAPIRVIVGNPPYSVGQRSANDDNQNLNYPTLNERIADTYAARSTGGLKKGLYDSYIRAFRWATDRIGDQGLIAFVANNGWVDSTSADGLRKTFGEEFSDIWVYNLRGNQRTAGELSRQEGGKVFGSGARTGVAILIALKNESRREPCRIHYYAVPDYQDASRKLSDINDCSLHSVGWTLINPSPEGDWINKRNPQYQIFLGIHTSKTEVGHFTIRSLGVSTNRDSWCWNYSSKLLGENITSLTSVYNSFAEQRRGPESESDRNPRLISWTRELARTANSGKKISFSESAIRTAHYRPFSRQYLYFDPVLNTVQGKASLLEPTVHHRNLAITISDGAGYAGLPLMVAGIPDLHLAGDTSYFPRWTYEKPAEDEQASLLEASDSDVDEWGYRRVDNITDEIVAVYQEKFGPSVAKDDIFFYVYGVLHSEQYRTTFAADLKRMLPRIPLAATASDFEAFVDAGRTLADLHVNYESVEPYSLHEKVTVDGDPYEVFKVTKMRWKDKDTKTTLIYNNHVTLSDIPQAAHRYMLGSRSALEWIIDRYRVTTHKASQITNDPNDWCREHEEPRYIVDLIKRVVRVSIDTMNIVDALPKLPLEA